MNAFVYGTLMTSEIFNKVVFGTLTTDYKLKRSKAILKNYKRFTAPNRNYPGIRPIAANDNNGSEFEVEGLLIEGLLPSHVKDLDAFEGSEYERIQVPVTVPSTSDSNSRTVTAYVYLWKEEIEQSRLINMPTWELENFRTNTLLEVIDDPVQLLRLRYEEAEK